MSYKILSNINNTPIVQTEIRYLLSTHFDNVYENGEVFNFRCNICGDSESRKNIKRGFILKKNNPWMFYCHNCGKSMNVINWLRQYFPSEYRTIMAKIVTNDNVQSDVQLNVGVKDAYDESSVIKHFKKITNFPFAVDYCKSRKIPESIYSKFFYDESGEYKDRIVIPFYDDKGKIYYYQGRAYHSWMTPRYKSRKGNRNSIYNYYNVDKTKYVTVLEGPIDSMFVENSIALTGLNKVKNSYIDKFPLKRFMFDNDDAGKKQSIKNIEDGNKVFNWSLFLRENDLSTSSIKDVNDFILKNGQGIEMLTSDIIDGFFTDNYGDRIYFA